MHAFPAEVASSRSSVEPYERHDGALAEALQLAEAWRERKKELGVAEAHGEKTKRQERVVVLMSPMEGGDENEEAEGEEGTPEAQQEEQQRQQTEVVPREGGMKPRSTEIREEVEDREHCGGGNRDREDKRRWGREHRGMGRSRDKDGNTRGAEVIEIDATTPIKDKGEEAAFVPLSANAQHSHTNDFRWDDDGVLLEELSSRVNQKYGGCELLYAEPMGSHYSYPQAPHKVIGKMLVSPTRRHQVGFPVAPERLGEDNPYHHPPAGSTQSYFAEEPQAYQVPPVPWHHEPVQPPRQVPPVPWHNEPPVQPPRQVLPTPKPVLFEQEITTQVMQGQLDTRPLVARERELRSFQTATPATPTTPATPQLQYKVGQVGGDSVQSKGTLPPPEHLSEQGLALSDGQLESLAHAVVSRPREEHRPPPPPLLSTAAAAIRHTPRTSPAAPTRVLRRNPATACPSCGAVIVFKSRTANKYCTQCGYRL